MTMRLFSVKVLFCFLILGQTGGVLGPGVAVWAVEGKSHAQQSLERRQKVELLSFFLKEPGQARMPKTPMAIELFNQGVQQYEKKEYDLALESLTDSLEYDASNAFAYEIIGDIHYFKQNMAKANDYYRKAFELQPRDSLKKKMAKVREEAALEKDLSTYREQHFLIKYHSEKEDYEGFELRELLRELYRDISQDFGYYFKHRTVVLLYEGEEFEELSSRPHWAAGLYDGKIRLPAYQDNMSKQDLRALVAHEMTHAFVATISRGRAPVWIHEGLAQYEENKIKKVSTRDVSNAAKSGQLIPMDQFLTQGALGGSSNMIQVNLFYKQAFHFMNYLIKRYGMFRVKKVLEAFGERKNSDEALRNVLRISPERLEREWKETL